MGMNKSERKAFSRMLQRREKADRAKREKQQAKEQAEADETAVTAEAAPDLAKTTKLVFFRHYNTYQALLEVHPLKDLNLDAVYAKVILYIMRWFRNRLGEGVCSERADLAFLREDYPEPEDYAAFRLEDVSNINGFDFIDFETAFLNHRQAWVVRLVEPDNGQERKDIQGRTFTTEISVYKQERSVVLGIREACREPEKNTEDAFGYRPGFVRDIFYDPDLCITEEGLDPEYAFAKEAYRLNGKSAEASRNLYENLIISAGRQMPILFIPGTYYDDHAEEVNRKTISLLGYCHVVVLENGCRKLFEQVMENEELVEVAEEGQLIFYRTNSLQEYPPAYYEEDTEDLLEQIKTVAQNEPLRKFCDFKDYSFKPSWWESPQEGSDLRGAEVDEIKSRYEAEISRLRNEKSDLERDNDRLQRNLNEITQDNKRLDKQVTGHFSDLSRIRKKLNDAIEARDREKEEKNRIREEAMREGMIAKGMVSEVKERYRPIINLPAFGLQNKEEILQWIRTNYSDVLVILPNGERSFYADSRNIDWHRFCMMIHYLAGYTRERNLGGIALDPMAARDYDAEDSGYKVEPAGSGQGALEFYKDKYTVTIEEKGEKKAVLLDLHLKYGKGMDDNMIRIYFHYSAPEKKTFIGYMPGHLPIR